MRRLVIFTGLLFVTTPLVQAANPCTNGSFEQLGPGGFAVDWSPIGSQVEVVSEARTGSHAVRLIRTAETPDAETGLNRAGRPGTGEGGAMLELRRGGLEFWYKAESAESADLCVYAIPMNADGIEGTGSPRARFTVPGAHIGDEQWHRGRLTFDFTDNPDVRWVQVASRIVGTAGELILDDFAYVDRVGAILQVGAIQIQEDGDRAGQRAVVQARIENVGDADAQAVLVALEPSTSLIVQPA